jgi:hypothetical protein
MGMGGPYSAEDIALSEPEPSTRQGFDKVWWSLTGDESYQVEFIEVLSGGNGKFRNVIAWEVKPYEQHGRGYGIVAKGHGADLATAHREASKAVALLFRLEEIEEGSQEEPEEAAREPVDVQRYLVITKEDADRIASALKQAGVLDGIATRLREDTGGDMEEIARTLKQPWQQPSAQYSGRRIARLLERARGERAPGPHVPTEGKR